MQSDMKKLLIGPKFISCINTGNQLFNSLTQSDNQLDNQKRTRSLLHYLNWFLRTTLTISPKNTTTI